MTVEHEPTTRMTHRKKLIEVALPLPEINDASAYDKMPGIGPHPKGIHHWWARLPLPTARAVLFASVVDDPASHPEKWGTEEEQDRERERLFGIMRRMMGKKLHERRDVYAEARGEMLRHVDALPILLDPFSGGGSIPLEGLRLGFPVQARDLNPVAVMINKAALEVAPAWAHARPVNPSVHGNPMLDRPWPRLAGFAEDIRYYAGWVAARASSAFGQCYPGTVTGKKAVAWLWCRTVASPDPSRHGQHVPLIRSFRLAKRKKEAVWLEPVVEGELNRWSFRISSAAPEVVSTVGRRGGTCILSGTPIPLDYIRSEGKAGRLGLRLLAVVGEGRQYFAADEWPAPRLEQEPQYELEEMPHNPFAVRPPLYGLNRFSDVFTARQLSTLEGLADLIQEVRDQVHADVARAGDGRSAQRYADAITTFLAFGLDRAVDFNNGLCRWSSSNEKVMSTFGRPALPMIWDFAEANLLGDGVGSWHACSNYVADCVEVLLTGDEHVGTVVQADAAGLGQRKEAYLVSTDPPYYNNVSYADLSDFFYVWLRRSLQAVYPTVFETLLTPKTAELVASPYRFDGDKAAARDHFENGFRHVFDDLRPSLDSRFPVTVYYAFKQADEDGDNDDDDDAPVDTTTGWETLLEALIGSGFQITGTWPVRASQRWRQMSMGMNALASYIVLSCRPRPAEALPTDRRWFASELRRELPSALRHLRQGNIAPVDFAQAAIGPGMSVFSRYAGVLESDGRPMTVRAVLSLINQTLTEVLAEQEDEFDRDTRWAIAWFEQHGFAEGEFGDAELLSKAKVTSVNGLQQAGLVHSRGGKVRLLRPDELPADWAATSDTRLTVWEVVHHLIRVYFVDKAGDASTAALLRTVPTVAGLARDLAYQLFSAAEKRGWSAEAQSYNALVLGWPEFAQMAQDGHDAIRQQSDLF